MFEPGIIVMIAGIFLLAGTIKGVIGLGLPTVSLALVTVLVDLPTAMALMLVPSFVTNIWQAVVGGESKFVIKKIWPFLLAAMLTIGLGAQVLKQMDFSSLSVLLGILIMGYAIVSLTGFRLFITPPRQRWLGPLTGAINGVLTGMTGSFVVPGVMYLQSIELTRRQLIQAMGMLFSVSTLALGIALYGNGLLTREFSLASCLAIVPAVAGMLLGQLIRNKLSEAVFRKVFFVSLLVLGFYIVVSTLNP